MTKGDQNIAKAADWSADDYITNASFVPKLTEPLLKLLDVQPDDSIYDLGCGDGILTAQIAKRCKKVVGTDYSADMIDKATKTYRQDNLSFRVVDGHELESDIRQDEAFNKVVTNAALHWMKRDPPKVVAGVARLLSQSKAKERYFVGEFGGFMNVADVRTALYSVLQRDFGMTRDHIASHLDPWYFPSPDTYKKVLEEAGFTVESIELVPRITEMTTDIKGWLDTFAFSFLGELSIRDQDRAKDLVVEHLRPGSLRDDGKWCVMYVRLRFKARI